MRNVEWPSDVRDAVEEIHLEAYRDEGSAQGLEVRLHIRVLELISHGSSCEWSRIMATEALKTCDLDFERWYAWDTE